MEIKDEFAVKCELCGGFHDAFEVSGCFNRSIENILKENPNHFKESPKPSLKLT